MNQRIIPVTSARAAMVFPCRNEAGTIVSCIEKVRTRVPDWEIVVADNGSTDDSARIAARAGARVMVESRPGYGAALKCGLAAADAEWLLYADADGTYCLEHCAELLEAATAAEADLVIASRYGRAAPDSPAPAGPGIQPGAMPWTHRCLGTPLLTWLINRLFGTRLSDCNSGFRCVRKSAYEQWNLRCDGMEFASEMIIKAAKAGAKIIEIPGGLRPSPAGRRPHLRTWRDGMRHLLFILSERPRLFEVCGLAMTGGATALQTVAVLTGPVRMLGVSVFDVHTNALLILGAVLGVNLWTLSMAMMKPAGEVPLRITRRFMDMDEGALFFLLLTLMALAAGAAVMLVLVWAHQGFQGIHFAHGLLGAVHGIALLASLAVGLLSAAILQRADAHSPTPRQKSPSPESEKVPGSGDNGVDPPV